MRVKYSWLGIASVFFYLGITILSRQFNWGEGYAKRPIISYLVLYAGAFVTYAWAVERILRNREKPPSIWFILIFGLFFRAAILPSNQIQEDDIYRYLWDGKVFANGVNPYKFSPTEINDAKSFRISEPGKFGDRYGEREREELELLYGLKWKNDRSIIFMERINHPDVPTIYPPLAQIVFRVVNQIRPDSILAMRLAFLVFDLLALAFIVKILETLGKNTAFSLIYFWSPLIIKETFNSTHLDIIGIAALCGSLYFLLSGCRVIAMGFLALGTMGKFYPAILLPVFIRSMIQNRSVDEPLVKAWTVLGVGVTLFLMVCAGFYLQFLDVGEKTFAGLKTFTTFWENNDSLFAILVFVYKKILGFEQSFTLEEEARLLSYDLPTFLAKLTATGILGFSVLWLVIRPGFLRQEQSLRHCYIVMALAFLLSPVQNPWYLNWIIPFLCFFPSRKWILLTGFIGFYYMDFYLDYQGINGYETLLLWVEYSPFYFMLIWDYIKKLG